MILAIDPAPQAVCGSCGAVIDIAPDCTQEDLAEWTCDRCLGKRKANANKATHPAPKQEREAGEGSWVGQ